MEDSQGLPLMLLTISYVPQLQAISGYVFLWQLSVLCWYYEKGQKNPVRSLNQFLPGHSVAIKWVAAVWTPVFRGSFFRCCFLACGALSVFYCLFVCLLCLCVFVCFCEHMHNRGEYGQLSHRKQILDAVPAHVCLLKHSIPKTKL